MTSLGLNAARFAEWHADFYPRKCTPSDPCLQRDVYTGMQAETFSQDDFAFAQSHLRILSGLYGILRPLDLMQPYRLEMGIRLKTPVEKIYMSFGRHHHQAIKSRISGAKDQILVNLASDEYFKSVNTKKLDGQIIKPYFSLMKKMVNIKLSVFMQKARGLMSRFIIQNKLTKTDQLADFNLEGYQFDESQSKGNELVFTRSEQA